MTFDVRRAASHVVQPWRNGGGLTAEVAVSPESADFDWRLSFAEVENSGDFSVFPGVDRVITLLTDTSMTLHLPDGPERLHRFTPFAFDGGVDVHCTVDQPARDLNVMTRRGRTRADVEVLEVGPDDPLAVLGASPLVLVALAGEIVVAGDTHTARLAPHDVVLTDEAVTVRGEGRVAAVRLGPATPAGAASARRR